LVDKFLLRPKRVMASWYLSSDRYRWFLLGLLPSINSHDADLHILPLGLHHHRLTWHLLEKDSLTARLQHHLLYGSVVMSGAGDGYRKLKDWLLVR
jgi:hypothetical protein